MGHRDFDICASTMPGCTRGLSFLLYGAVLFSLALKSRRPSGQPRQISRPVLRIIPKTSLGIFLPPSRESRNLCLQACLDINRFPGCLLHRISSIPSKIESTSSELTSLSTSLTVPMRSSKPFSSCLRCPGAAFLLQLLQVFSVLFRVLHKPPCIQSCTVRHADVSSSWVYRPDPRTRGLQCLLRSGFNLAGEGTAEAFQVAFSCVTNLKGWKAKT